MKISTIQIFKDVASQNHVESEEEKGEFNDPDLESDNENEREEQADSDDDSDNSENIPLKGIKELLYCSHNKLMKVYELKANLDNDITGNKLWRYIEILKIPNFRGIFKPNELPERINNVECGIIKWNDLYKHYTVYTKIHNMRIHFDPCGEGSPLIIQKYLKTRREYRNGEQVIHSNKDNFQGKNTRACAYLCLYVLTSLMRENLTYREIINQLRYGFSKHYW